MRISWLITDLFLVVLIGCLALAMSAAWILASLRYDDPPPPDTPAPSITSHAVPLSAVALPAEHRITLDDIRMEEMSSKSLKRTVKVDYWDQLFMKPEDLVGRVLRRAKGPGEPFLATELFLEGMEPGAPPESLAAEDLPWPPLAEIDLLSRDYAAAKQLAARDETDFETVDIFLAMAIVDLPAGRVVRNSDIALDRASLARLRERALPEFEVLTTIDQFAGRRLVRPKRMGEPFLLSDFVVNGEIETYLQRSLPNFKSRKLDELRDELAAKQTPAHDYFPVRQTQRPAPINANLPDNPDALFGALPEDAAYRPSSALGKVLEHEDLMIQLAWRFEPILPVSPGVNDLRDVMGTTLAPPPAPGVAGLGLGDGHARTWFGGATLTHDASTGGASGAIAAVRQTPTDDNYKLRLPRERKPAEQPDAEESEPPELWWRKVDPFGIAPPNPLDAYEFELP